MDKKRDGLETMYAARRKKLLRNIPGDAALFTAAPETIECRDVHHPHHQNTDFFYLTGIEEPNAALLLLSGSQGPRSVLFVRERDAVREVWDGERLGTQRAKRRFRVDEVRDIEQLHKALPLLVANAQTLWFTPGVDPALDQHVFSLFQTSVAPRLNFPSGFRDARVLTSEMRFVKDKAEMRMLRYAVDITADGLVELAPQLKNFTSEVQCARALEGIFAKLGGKGVSFQTIIAAGKNATTLHHRPVMQPLWKRELVLVDCGARYRGYAGDISRTLPVSGKFTTAQAEVYDIVHAALLAATKRAKPGNTLETIHRAAVGTIVKGLVEIRALKGNISQLIESGAYQAFFPHRTSHWLGLDVHDIAPVTYVKGQPQSAWKRPLVPGNVITIEPGLYFQVKDARAPKQYRGIGVRIEDDVLITENGCEVLSRRVPSSRSEIEALFS